MIMKDNQVLDVCVIPYRFLVGVMMPISTVKRARPIWMIRLAGSLMMPVKAPRPGTITCSDWPLRHTWPGSTTTRDAF